MRNPFKRLIAFKRNEDGTATVEFVFLFPLFMAIFLMGFESGYYMVRNVMLERAVDISVREIRLGNGRVPDFDLLKAQICETGLIFPDCQDPASPSRAIHITMEEIDITPGAIAAFQGPAKCTNQFSNEPQWDETDYNPGDTNRMMIIQVCAAVTPLFPTTGIGLGLQNDELGGAYALVATSAFVTEPGTRSFTTNPYTTTASDGSDGTVPDDGST
ncbi:MAG: TadE/TadG family type IV pilus assembly protein [Paracoccaceae bacterium]